MGRFHRNGRHFDKTLILKIILIGLFLLFAYQYYTENLMNAFFTTLIMLPLIQKAVEGYVYWIIVAIIIFCIWKAVDYFN